jgi:tetratricopeptide (TPR) repeat protein
MSCFMWWHRAGASRRRFIAHARASIARAALLVVLLLGWSSGGAAQSAKELYERGVQALNAGQFADAVTSLDASYRKEQSPAALYNLGLAYKGLGHPDKALEAFEGYVRFADKKKDAKTIAAVRGEIERLKNGYARFALKLTPPDAIIEIDGLRATPSKNELWVQTGKHKIAVRAAGYETYQQELDVAAGRFDLEVHLREPSGPPDQRAAALVDEGMALQAAGSLQAALDKYKEAQTIHPTPRAQAQMGLTAESMGDLGAAERDIAQALSMRKDPWVKENRRKLQTALNRLKRQLATLDITGKPQGAEVFVNERSQGKLPLVAAVRVGGGTITVRAKKDGYRDFEQVLDLPPRAKRIIKIDMEEAPVPIAAPVPVPAPVPAEPPAQAAVPALTAEPATPPPSELPPPDRPKPEQPSATQADVESLSDAREDLAGEPPAGSDDPATGFEMALNFGYQPWIGGPKLSGSDGLLTPQIALGARPIWPLSFGLMITGGVDLGAAGTKVVAGVNPGLYVRGHVQQKKKELWFDVWGGVGIQPFAVQAAVLEPEDIDISMIDPNAIDPDIIARQMAANAAGVDLVHTIQSINVPLELGGTFWITKGFGVNLALGLTFWLPQQECLHDGDDRLCTEEGLESQTSFFAGGGLAFLP